MPISCPVTDWELRTFIIASLPSSPNRSVRNAVSQRSEPPRVAGRHHKMRIAILGATSQIARDFIVSLARAGEGDELYLFARRPAAVSEWLVSLGIGGHYAVGEFSAFGKNTYDAIVNFVGVGDPARTAVMGASIFGVTFEFDRLALDYLDRHDRCRYLFLSSGAAYGCGFEEPVRRSSRAVFRAGDLPPQEWYGAA